MKTGSIAKTSIATKSGIKVLGNILKISSISVIIILRKCICKSFMLKLDYKDGVTPVKITDSALDELNYLARNNSERAQKDYPSSKRVKIHGAIRRYRFFI
jgi:hypothetical protein